MMFCCFSWVISLKLYILRVSWVVCLRNKQKKIKRIEIKKCYFKLVGTNHFCISTMSVFVLNSVSVALTVYVYNFS